MGMKDCHVNPGNIVRLTEAVSKRFKHGFTLDVAITERMGSSTGTFKGDKVTQFVNKKLTGDLKSDFTGLGDAGIKLLAAKHITTSDGLFAEVLMLLTEEKASFPDSGHCAGEQIVKKLGELGVAHGSKTAVAVQLLTKLQYGIDSGA